MNTKTTEAASAVPAAPDSVSVRIIKTGVTVDGAPAPLGKVIPIEKAKADILVGASLAELHTPQPGDDVPVRIRVTQHAAPLAGMICAKGHEGTYPKAQADLFVKQGLAEIIGV